MHNYIFDNIVFYDLESHEIDPQQKIEYMVKNEERFSFYVRPHRDDGPAIIKEDGYQVYFIEGNQHRDDGPAVIYANGRTLWWLYGYEYPFDYWCKKLDKSDEEINFLKLKWNIT